MTAPSREVQELAAAIRDALNVPIADNDPVAERAEEALRLGRAAQVQGALAGLADGVGAVSSAAATIREWTAATPVTYAVYQKVEAAS